MRQSSCELSKRDQLFVAQIARCERASTINHDVHQYVRDHRTFADHLREHLTRDEQKFCRFLCNDIVWGCNDARIRHHSTDIAALPLEDFVRASAAIEPD